MKIFDADSPQIAVIFPSRGLAFSQTCEELLDNLEDYDYDIFFSHGLSIPNCFNKPLERALEGSYTHFWFVEDDMILPKNTLKRLLAENVPAIMCDYPMDEQGKAAIFQDPDGNVIYGGTGCLLVTREFLETYKTPVFHSTIAWDIQVGELVEVKPRQIKGDLYGLHDVNFSLEAYQRGTPIKVSKVVCGHRKLRELGPDATNIGMHDIETWTKLIPNKMGMGKVISKNVRLTDGTLVYMKLDRARELEKQGKLSIPSGYVEFL